MNKSKFILILTAFLMAALVFSCASSGGASGNTAAKEPFRWSFDDPDAGTAGWAAAPDEFWDFKGTMEVRRDDDTPFGKPMLRIDVDFSKDSGSWWSEPKLKYNFDETFEMAGFTNFAFDMYYNPNFSTTGSFKGKAVGFNGKTSVWENELESMRGREEVGEYLKAAISFRCRSSRSIDNIVLGIVGAMTNYNGPIFIDNMRLE